MRGLPGSGKTTLANILLMAANLEGDGNDDEGGGAAAAKGKKYRGIRASADDFFIDKQGNYVYIPHVIAKAHEWCQNKAKKAMEAKVNPVIIDNTNIKVGFTTDYSFLDEVYLDFNSR